MTRFILSFSLLFLSAFAMAQQPTFAITPDTLQLKIGEPITLTLSASLPAEKTFVWPYFEPAKHRSLALIDSSSLDTAEQNGQWLIRQSWRLTSFDSGMAKLSPLYLIASGDSLSSDTLSFYVSFPAQESNVELYDLKDPLDVALTWWERYRWYIIVAAVLLFFFLLWKFRARLRSQSVDQPILKKALPAHEEALVALKQLAQEELWQNGRYKEYYSRLIDILRHYLERRYALKVMELTAGELSAKMQENQQVRYYWDQELKAAVEQSAMVKYAKEKPLPQQNEAAWQAVHQFVENSKVTEEKEDHA